MYSPSFTTKKGTASDAATVLTDLPTPVPQTASANGGARASVCERGLVSPLAAFRLAYPVFIPQNLHLCAAARGKYLRTRQSMACTTFGPWFCSECRHICNPLRCPWLSSFGLDVPDVSPLFLAHSDPHASDTRTLLICAFAYLWGETPHCCRNDRACPEVA